ncbi:MAG: class I SAM-dependent methyltransferase [Polyangiaceae bacterium]
MNSGNSIQTRDGSGEMFDGIAARYDLLNRVMSLGMDRHWRNVATRALELKSGDRVLDLATGTADLAIEIARQEPTVRVVGLESIDTNARRWPHETPTQPVRRPHRARRR